jgi:CRISPR-associated endonuclease/helicase Cas3
LRQRFGRLDRIGHNKATQAVILKLKRAKDREWIYGEALDNAWKWLNEHAVEEQGRTVIDFGVRKMSELFEQEGNASLNTAGETGPLMFPAHVDAWVQTSPKPAADPDVAPFLHGSKALQSSDVQIVWRADLTEELDADQWIDALAAAPPVSTEAMPLPIGLARKWLRGQVGQATDVEGGSGEPNGEERGDTTRQFLIWRGPEESLQGVPDNLRPGDTIVVRSEEGGSDQWGWNPDSRFVQDIGDLCANERARAGLGRLRIRLHPWVVFPYDAAKRTELANLLKEAAEDDEEALKKAKALAAEAVPVGAKLDEWRWDDYGGHWLIGISPWQKRKTLEAAEAPPEAPPEETEDSLTHRMSLREHTDGVIRWAKGFTQKCGLPAEASASIELAAKLHDAGKCDDRFQMLLDPYRSPAEEPLAKGEPAASAAAFRRRREWAEYPKGARHELASVAMTDSYSGWPENCDRELVLYLIGTHHGYARPLPPVWFEDRPDSLIRAQGFGAAVQAARAVELAGLDSGWVDRFWSLTRKYGWWGLAYLEAVLRRADCMRSREEEDGK